LDRDARGVRLPGLAGIASREQKPVITVVGKAFYDVDHAPRNQTNRQNNMPSFAVWEIHHHQVALTWRKAEALTPRCRKSRQRPNFEEP
jgi:hypothetical protein